MRRAGHAAPDRWGGLALHVGHALILCWFA